MKQALKSKFFVLLTSIFLLTVQNGYSQKITGNPTVEYDCSDENSAFVITSIITSDEITLVTLQYATTMFKSWIRMESRTNLVCDKSKSKYEILDWGIISKDKYGELEFSSLQFDEAYNTKRRIAYDFYMVFPAIPQNATLLSIQEPIKDGFFWKNIHINDKNTTDISKGKGVTYPQGREFRPNGTGSGFAINIDGYIATCNHVIVGARTIQVKGVNGNFEKGLNARVVTVDDKNDLAILKIEGIRFPTLPYSFSSVLSDVGEDVFVLGYPQTQHLGEELKLTTGVISSHSGYRGDITTYQISAQALSGNSGCPLFDENGDVIGVVNAKYIEPNVSYAVKLPYLKILIEKSEIRGIQPTSNSISGKRLADKVKSIRDFVYIIEVEK